jgi:hypothetical protein
VVLTEFGDEHHVVDGHQEACERAATESRMVMELLMIAIQEDLCQKSETISSSVAVFYHNNTIMYSSDVQSLNPVEYYVVHTKMP